MPPPSLSSSSLREPRHNTSRVCGRHILLSTAAVLLLGPTVLATPAWFGASPEAIPSSAPTLSPLRIQSPRPDLPAYFQFSAPSVRIQRCFGVRCLWDYLSQKAKTAAERLGGDVEELADFIAYSHDDTLPIPKDVTDGEEWPDDRKDAKLMPESEAQGVPTRSKDVDGYIRAPYPRQPPLLMTVALLAIAIGYFSLLGIHHLQRRTARLCLQEQVLPTVSNDHGRRHGNSGSARRARRKLQQRAITKCMRGVLRRWTRGDVAAAGDGRRSVAGGNVKAATEGEASTMEEDIARLRDVANFIDDVVAAEQGMVRLGCSASTPCSQRDSSVPGQDFAYMDQNCLPSYDTATTDQSLVSDGFRYAPEPSMSSSGQSEGDGRACTKQ